MDYQEAKIQGPLQVIYLSSHLGSPKTALQTVGRQRLAIIALSASLVHSTRGVCFYMYRPRNPSVTHGGQTFVLLQGNVNQISKDFGLNCDEPESES